MKMRNVLALFLAIAMMACLLAGCGPTGSNTPSGDGQNSTQGTVSSDEANAIKEKYANLAYFDEEHPERYGGVLTYASGTADAHLDINAAGAASGTSYWARYVYESALATGIDGKLYPLVCEYRYDEENQAWLELWVREGVTFHDGSLVEIEDVWASYNRNAKYQHILEGIVSAEINDGVLRIEYDTANGYNCIKPLYWFGYHDCSFGVMPKEICEQFDAKNNVILDPQYVIGTGAYKIVPEEYVPMELYPLVRHDGYIPCFDGDVLGDTPNGRAAPRIAYLDRIDIVINTDSNTSMMQLLNGVYDVIYSSTEVFDATLKPLGYQMYEDPAGKPISDTPALFFNLHSEETAVNDGKASTSILADDVNLRKAICAAINVDEAMYATYNTWWIAETSPVNCEGYSKAAFENADYRSQYGNLEVAKAYLEKSNYAGQELVIRRPSSAGQAILQVIEKNCEAIGISIAIEAMDISAYQADYRCGDSGWDMYLLFGANTSSWAGFMPVNSYIPWGNEEAAGYRAILFSQLNGTEASIEAWNNLSQLMADECSYYVIGKSKGDRFVSPGDLNPNYSGYSYYGSAYWDDPSQHMERSVG